MSSEQFCRALSNKVFLKLSGAIGARGILCRAAYLVDFSVGNDPNAELSVCNALLHIVRSDMFEHVGAVWVSPILHRRQYGTDAGPDTQTCCLHR